LRTAGAGSGKGPGRAIRERPAEDDETVISAETIRRFSPSRPVRADHRAPRSSDANDHIKVLFYDGAIVLDPNEIIICWPRQQDRADRVAIIATNRAAVGAGG
jgi:hypothetical protein